MMFSFVRENGRIGREFRSFAVVPAKAGTPGREVAAGLPDIPGCAGTSISPER
jgi:hypothetical protein